MIICLKQLSIICLINNLNNTVLSLKLFLSLNFIIFSFSGKISCFSIRYQQQLLFGGIYKIMTSQLAAFLRLSPYQRSHITKYEPNALLSSSDAKSSIEVGTYTSQLGFKGTSSMQAEQPFIEKICYFCKDKSISAAQFHHCGECKKIVCDKCESKCTKCEKILCQLDRSYDYSIESIICFSC